MYPALLMEGALVIPPSCVRVAMDGQEQIAQKNFARVALLGTRCPVAITKRTCSSLKSVVTWVSAIDRLELAHAWLVSQGPRAIECCVQESLTRAVGMAHAKT